MTINRSFGNVSEMQILRPHSRYTCTCVSTSSPGDSEAHHHWRAIALRSAPQSAYFLLLPYKHFPSSYCTLLYLCVYVDTWMYVYSWMCVYIKFLSQGFVRALYNTWIMFSPPLSLCSVVLSLFVMSNSLQPCVL